MARSGCTRLALPCALVGTAALLAGPRSAIAEQARYWRTERPDRPGQLTLGAHTSFAVIGFSRPERACIQGTAARLRAWGSLRPAQDEGPEPFCPAADSTEAAFSLGLTLGFRVAGPFHLSWGIDVGYTDPQFEVLSPQTVITMPFGLLLTWTEWPVRPIAEALAIPFVLIPDGVKDVMFGGRVGVAFPIGDVDLGLTLGYAHDDALRPWDFRIGLLHLP